MQLLPSTARQYARKLNLRYSSRLLTDPEANIRMGTAYFADTDQAVRRRAPGAGQLQRRRAAVRRWVAERPGLEREEFIDDIPYPETQNYVKRILGTAEDYRRLYGTSRSHSMTVAGLSSRDRPAEQGRPRVRPLQSATCRFSRSPLMSKFTGSKKATQFTESVIREMTRLNQLHGGVNLSQGFPDFPAPAVVKDAACAAIQADVNQYAVTWGARSLREAIAGSSPALRRAGRRPTSRSRSAAARPKR